MSFEPVLRNPDLPNFKKTKFSRLAGSGRTTRRAAPKHSPGRLIMILLKKRFCLLLFRDLSSSGRTACRSPGRISR